MRIKENIYSRYNWKVSTALLFITILISALIFFFLGYPTFLSSNWKPTLLVKWESSNDIKVANLSTFFWLINSEEQMKEALAQGIPSQQLVLDLREGLKIDLFQVEQALYNDSNLANAITGKQIRDAWFQRKIGRKWQGFNWSAEVVEAYDIYLWHRLDPSRVVLLEATQIAKFASSSKHLPIWERKFLPAYELLVAICFIICGLLIHPFAFIGAVFIGSGYWYLNITLQQEFILWVIALALLFSHWKNIWQRYKLRCSESAHGILHSIFLWPFRTLVASAVVYLGAWREDLGYFLVQSTSWALTNSHEALACLIIASLLVWLTSFVPWLWAKILLSSSIFIPVLFFLSFFQQGQINFPNLWSGSIATLLLIKLILLTLILFSLRFKERTGHVHLGYFGFGNLGDDLLLICQLRRQKEVQEHSIICSSRSKLPIESKQTDVIFRNDLAAILDRLSRRERMCLGPGGILQDKSSQKSLLYYLAFGMLARVMGCTLQWSGQGFSPFKFKSSNYLVLSASFFVSLIEVRDEASRDYLTSLGVNPSKIELTRDLVWDFDLPQRYSSSKSLAVVLRSWKDAPLDQWIKELASIGIKRQYFLFEKDVELERKIRLLDPKATVFVYRGDWREFLKRFYACSHILSMRFHGLILGLKSERICFSLAYDEKCELTEISPEFILKPAQWNTLFPYIRDFVETISPKRS
tara:strand:- start:4070 stop:6163 length:2094 start_codon:yes stop_codon:yes gene_type:complete